MAATGRCGTDVGRGHPACGGGPRLDTARASGTGLMATMGMRPRPAWRFVVVSAVFLAAWLGVDCAIVRSGDTFKLAPIWSYAFVALAWVGFLWASLPLFPARSVAWRNAGRGLVSLLALTGWLIASSLVVVQFHHFISGGL